MLFEMRKSYVSYTRDEFRDRLYGIRWMLGLSESFEDVTREIGTGEVVYELDVTREFGLTDGVARRLRVYTTIDEASGLTYGLGSTKVKVLLVESDGRGERYSRVGNHLRIATLFDNLKETIDRVMREVSSGVTYRSETCLLRALASG